MMKDANNPVGTTEKSLNLIDRLRELDGARIHELESDVDMTKGAIHNHLTTLQKHGYVKKEKHEYRLSFKFLTIGGEAIIDCPLYQFGRSKVNQLADGTGMLSNLGVEENGECVYLYQSRGEYAVNLDTRIGSRLPLHNIALGKAILAHLPRHYVDEIIDRKGLPEATENTITNKTDLYQELEKIKSQGYAVDDEERTEGLCCVAAPVRPENEILGAVSISASSSRFENNELKDEIINEVKSTAHEISLEILY
ncbi:IclR family transcriptional regulator [Natrarchaeobaculum aegyptiacum]|uniref:IclR family transcriptional regulator n=1 Tax=Natrarchaeobaculum aegyptiacum TaxID=745377 RepID=A0A2Z2HX24_9EURY|nr:IclR family transcriptional regulator [Natrarchaeobaculum aegyptiacum]ARS90735.1 IclR family transcriptional regulator [Natrarchaeobaculum aegyptiacum]